MAIVTRPATNEYRDNFEATFGKKKPEPCISIGCEQEKDHEPPCGPKPAEESDQ